MWNQLKEDHMMVSLCAENIIMWLKLHLFLLFSVLMSPSSSSSPPFYIVVFPYCTLPHPLHLCILPIFLPPLAVSSNYPLPLSLFSLQVCCDPGLRAAAAAVPRPLWLPPQVASDSTGAAAVQRGQPHHRGPAEKSAAAKGVCVYPNSAPSGLT